MQIKITKPTFCDGAHVKPGDVVDASPGTGSFLVNTGKAELYTEEPKPKKRAAKKSPENRMITEDDLENRGE